MANVKISNLPSATTPLVGTELVPIVQSGITKQVVVRDLNVGGESYICQLADSSAIASVSANTLTKLFYATTNGAATLSANTTYLFEGYFSLSGLTATSSTLGFGFTSTATITNISGFATGVKATTASTPTSMPLTAISNTVYSAASTNTTGWGYVNGRLTVTTTGTIVPSFSISSASTNVVVKAGSFFRFIPLGLNTLATIGTWT